jgi:four helix bundle protein
LVAVRDLLQALAMKRPCRFQDLIAWQLAVQLRQFTHAMCERTVIQRDFRFRNNLLDAASSAPRNIAEGFGRKYHRDFARFAIIARGSEQEVLDGFIEAHERRYINDTEFDRADHAARKAIKVLNGLIAYLESTPDWGRE